MLDQKTTTKKIVFVSESIPAESLRCAQVVILTEATCHLIAPQPYRAHLARGLMSDKELAASVTCPIVDVSTVGPELDEQEAEIMGRYTEARRGVIDLPALLEALSKIGARVTIPCPNCEGTQLHCVTCTYGAIQ